MNYSSVGKKIRQYRGGLGITQEKFAEMTNLSVPYVGAIERGEKLPRLETFVRIANALKVSSDTLLAEVLEVENEIVASALFDDLSQLPKNEQRRILNVVRIMIADARNS